jgi:multidrug efflux system outer membrane protein
MAPPATYRDGSDTQARETLADIPWWQVFQDEALQALIRDAIAHNYDLRVAIARVQEERALARVARSFL